MPKGIPTRREPTREDRRTWPMIVSQTTYSAGEVARFLAKVDVGAPDECWPWTSGVVAYRATKDGERRPGYGVLSRDNAMGGHVYAHRLSFELAYGPLPDGYASAHRCNYSLCANPAHLYAATSRQNTRDAYRDGLMHACHGEAHRLAKLTVAGVTRIRAELTSGVDPQELAADLGVTPGTVLCAGSGYTWAQVPGALGGIRGRYGAAARHDRETLAFIRAHWETFGRSPTLKQIAAALGLADASCALRRVRRLEAAGLVTRPVAEWSFGNPGQAARPILLVENIGA